MNNGQAWTTKVEDRSSDVFVDSIEQTLTVNTYVGGVFKAPIRNVAYWVQNDED